MDSMSHLLVSRSQPARPANLIPPDQAIIELALGGYVDESAVAERHPMHVARKVQQHLLRPPKRPRPGEHGFELFSFLKSALRRQKARTPPDLLNAIWKALDAADYHRIATFMRHALELSTQPS